MFLTGETLKGGNAMRKIDERIGFSLIPFDRGVGDNKKQIQPKVEIVSNSTYSEPIIEVKIDKTITKRVILNKKPVKFEKNRLPYILALPIIWLLTLWVMVKKFVYRRLGKTNPKINTFWFDGLGLSPRKVKENATSWQALDEIYNYQFGQRNGIGGLIDDFWEGMLNCQAVRNRLKIVKRELKQAILQFNNSKEVRILSLAAGSAQAVIETMAELQSEGIYIRTLLVDIDQTALDYAMQLAKLHCVSGQIKTVKASVAWVYRISRDFQPHIIEMVGLLDYIPREKAIKLVKKIQRSLVNKGIFLTCNIVSNFECHFLKWVVNWPMIYRTPSELVEIVREAGFSDYRLIFEPLKIHCFAIAQKK